MKPFSIIQQRLQNQGLINQPFTTPLEVVSWLGAVQSQDYAGAKWAVGMRTKNALDSDIEKAVDDGTIIRTHVMRPTWHFVAAADIRWMLALTAPRVNAAMGFHFRQHELDAAIFSRSNKIFTKVLQGGKALTRNELAAALERAGIVGSNLRIGGIVGRAELDMVICNGPRRGKQFTYALFDERVPTSKPLTHEEALAELTQRYFISHGPATLKDYVWWSGLTGADAKAGIELVKTELVKEVVNGETYWMGETAAAKSKSPIVHLLPNYDEYIVGYAERSAVYDAAHNDKLDSRGNFLFNYTIVLDGKVAGLWKRSFKKDTVTIEPTFFEALAKAQMRAFEETAERYGVFLEMKLEIAK